ncbi:MipA/OmpV family protein [Rhizobium sp. NLR9b]|uniref:MipA/OmpV family protein n=1 Tax=unclassified Rhizobium TaxID=2613769 RepID=UPI001C833EB9|nr:MULTISPECIES: MipA/OmpV family protein [unclassified Rhizobium]MBX5226387.1 MipA/OmpV family protein [Rhizobium sp. NLR9b]MBX5287060.1 MipA/OmpV family protein [Rhizobium sp. NLR10b]
MFHRSVVSISLAIACSSPALALAQESGQHFWSGDWYLSVGIAGFSAPKFEGSRRYEFRFSPLISAGRQGSAPRFSSRNDNPSFALMDNGAFRAGLVGKFVPSRDEGDGHELKGMKKVKWGAEAGGFVEVYPTDFLRARAEVRQGIRSHDGVVADLAVDAFTDIAPNLQLSGGPRATFATSGYYDAYYGVNAKQSAASGLDQYKPSSGIQSYGAGAALTWKATENLSASSFLEYKRLAGPAADSSLVRQRGSKNQVLIGVSATYRFNFSLQ